MSASTGGPHAKRCPFCGGCPQCCNEGRVLDPERDPESDEYGPHIACPTCQGNGLPKPSTGGGGDRLTAHERARLRSQAVEQVDNRHGYTVEFSNQPSVHHAEYDEREAELIAEAERSGGDQSSETADERRWEASVFHGDGETKRRPRKYIHGPATDGYERLMAESEHERQMVERGSESALSPAVIEMLRGAIAGDLLKRDHAPIFDEADAALAALAAVPPPVEGRRKNICGEQCTEGESDQHVFGLTGHCLECGCSPVEDGEG